jgi:hypothetical protein
MNKSANTHSLTEDNAILLVILGSISSKLSFKWPAASDGGQYNASCYHGWHYWQAWFQLQVMGDNTMLLVITGGITGELEILSSKIPQHDS